MASFFAVSSLTSSFLEPKEQKEGRQVGAGVREGLTLKARARACVCVLGEAEIQRTSEMGTSYALLFLNGFGGYGGCKRLLLLILEDCVLLAEICCAVLGGTLDCLGVQTLTAPSSGKIHA